MFTFTHQLILVELIIFVKSTPIKILDKGILPLEINSIAIQFFLDIENEDKLNSCKIYCRTTRCCLVDREETDCNSVKLHGEYDDVLNPKDRKTYLFLFLTLFHANQRGYCDFGLRHRCGRQLNKTEYIKVYFDTRLIKNKKQFLLRNFQGLKTKHCKTIDEDPLNGCEPVNCDLKYFGTKPVFKKDIKRCVDVPECISDLKKKLPDIVYEPISNTCKRLEHSLSLADIYAINSGLGVTVQSNATDEDLKVMTVKPNCSTISQNMLLLRDILYGKLNPVKGYTVDLQQSCNNAMRSILSCVFGLSVAIILFVCCANATVWFRKELRTGGIASRVNDLKSRMQSKPVERCEEKISRVNKDVTSKLLREVIVSDLPLELRDSVVDICERIGKEVRWKRRYRMIDAGSEINLRAVDESSDTSTTSDLDTSEKERFLK